jgi:hypothetical protein
MLLLSDSQIVFKIVFLKTVSILGAPKFAEQLNEAMSIHVRK